MNPLFHLLRCVIACGLIAAAFGYLFSPKATIEVVKRFAGTVGAVVLLLAVVRQFMASNPVGALVILSVLSVLAYFIRERRLKRRPPPRKAGSAERTPALPRREDQE